MKDIKQCCHMVFDDESQSCGLSSESCRAAILIPTVSYRVQGGFTF